MSMGYSRAGCSLYKNVTALFARLIWSLQKKNQREIFVTVTFKLVILLSPRDSSIFYLSLENLWTDVSKLFLDWSELAWAIDLENIYEPINFRKF